MIQLLLILPSFFIFGAYLFIVIFFKWNFSFQKFFNMNYSMEKKIIIFKKKKFLILKKINSNKVLIINLI